MKNSEVQKLETQKWLQVQTDNPAKSAKFSEDIQKEADFPALSFWYVIILWLNQLELIKNIQKQELFSVEEYSQADSKI